MGHICSVKLVLVLTRDSVKYTDTESMTNTIHLIGQ